jgi:hypothetical protein
MPLVRKTAAGSVELELAERVAHLRTGMNRIMTMTRQEFLVAFPGQVAPRTAWIDHAVPLHAFGPEHLPLAFRTDCPQHRDPGLVNSIFRPTLPPLALLSVQFP